MLIPFVYEAPSIRVDTLDSMLSDAHKALPEVIQIGNWLKRLPDTKLYAMINKMKGAVGEHRMKGWHCNMPCTLFVHKRSVTNSSMLGSLQYVVINPVQVARKANYSDVTSGGVWDHFITANSTCNSEMAAFWE